MVQAQEDLQGPVSDPDLGTIPVLGADLAWLKAPCVQGWGHEQPSAFSLQLLFSPLVGKEFVNHPQVPESFLFRFFL